MLYTHGRAADKKSVWIFFSCNKKPVTFLTFYLGPIIYVTPRLCVQVDFPILFVYRHQHSLYVVCSNLVCV
jgi:hypothetical protein